MCWVGLLNGQIIGTCWFADAQGRSMLVSQQMYLYVLQNQAAVNDSVSLWRVYFQQVRRWQRTAVVKNLDTGSTVAEVSTCHLNT